MAMLDLPIEIHSEVPHFSDRLEMEAESRLVELAEGHRDITGASVSITQPAHGETPYLYQARVVVYMRPDNLTAQEKHDTIEGALKGALKAIERQVRGRREKLGEPWKRPDFESGPDHPSPEGTEGPA